MEIIIAIGVFLFWYNAIDHTTIEEIKNTTRTVKTNDQRAKEYLP